MELVGVSKFGIYDVLCRVVSLISFGEKRRPDFWLPNFDGKMMLVGLARGQQGLFNSHDKEMTSARGPKSVML
jgi:hypothetical protein